MPEADDFGAEKFLRANDLEAIVEALLNARREDFAHLRTPGITVMAYWKASGGKSGGKLLLGKCEKPSGLLKHITHADYIIWLAADHLRQLKFNRFQTEALTFHELLHTDVDEKDNMIRRSHDFEGFYRELELYGPWKSDFEQLISAARMLPFD